MSSFFRNLFGGKKTAKVTKNGISRRLELLGLEDRITPAAFSVDAAGLITVQMAAGESLTGVSASVTTSTGNAVVTINVTSSIAPNTVSGTGLSLTTSGAAGAPSVITYDSNAAATPGNFVGISIFGSSGTETLTIANAVNLSTTNPAANSGFSVSSSVDNVNVNGAITAKGTGPVSITGTTVAFNSSGTINTTAGGVSVIGTSVATGGTTITTTTGGVNVSSPNTINGGTSAFTINSTSGTIGLSGFNSTGALNIASAGSIGLNAVTAASLNQTLAGSVTLGGTVNTTGAVSFAGNVSGTNTSITSSGDSVTFLGNVTSSGSTTVSAATSGKFINIEKTLSAGAGSAVNLTGTVKATNATTSEITASGAGAITITGGIDNASANDISIASLNGNITITGEIKGGNNVNIFSLGTGNIILNGLISNQSTGGAIDIFSQGGGNVTIDKDITTAGAGSTIILGDSASTGTGILTASGKLTSAGDVSLRMGSGGTLILGGAVSSVGDVVDFGGGKLNIGSTITTSAGNIILDSLVTTLTSDVSLKAAGTTKNINLASVNGNKNLTLEATGTITLSSLGQTTGLNTVTVNNSTGLTANAFTAAKVVLADSTNAIDFNGPTVITTSLTTAARGYAVNFSGTNTSIAGAPVFLNTGGVKFLGTTNLTTGATITGNATSTVELGGVVISGGAFNIGATSNTGVITINDATQLILSSPTAESIFANPVNISGATGTLILSGVGKLTLSGDSSAQAAGDTISVITGTLNVTGKLNAATTSTANTGTISGPGGQIGVLTVNSGTVAPGGTLKTAAVTLNAATNYNVAVLSSTAASNLQTAAAINLGSAALNVTSAVSGLKVNDVFTIINNTAPATTPVVGTFAGLAEGATVSAKDASGNTVTYTISYKGGTDANDVTLTVKSVSPSTPTPTAPAQPMVAGQSVLNKFTAIGADAGGGPVVTITFTNGTYVSFFAYPAVFTGGVRVALGDVNGDGSTDLITGAGPGGGPQVNVYNVNSSTGQVSLQSSFYAFNAPNFTGGVYVAAGHLNDDGFDDIIVGAGAGGGSRVQAYAGSASGASSTILADFFAYAPAFTGGVVVAAGNRDADAMDEIITAPASNGNWNIRSFDYISQGNVSLKENFYAFNDSTTVGGLSLAVGLFDAGGISDLVVGTNGGGYGVILNDLYQGIVTKPFEGFTGSVRAGVAEDSTGKDYAVAAAGPGGGPMIAVYSVTDKLTQTDRLFVLNPQFTGGLFMTPSLEESAS